MLDMEPAPDVMMTETKGGVLMGKKVLIISSSPVPGGKANSEMLCREFMRGAQECGHDVELVALRETNINF